MLNETSASVDAIPADWRVSKVICRAKLCGELVMIFAGRGKPSVVRSLQQVQQRHITNTDRPTKPKRMNHDQLEIHHAADWNRQST